MAQIHNNLERFSTLAERMDRTGDPQTLLVGNGFSQRAGLSFSSTRISASALEYALGRRAQELLRAVPHLMPEDALRYLRGYPLTHIPTQSETSEYRLLRQAYVRAVVDVHPSNPGVLRPDALAAAADLFRKFAAVYTTNYDRLAYWAIVQPDVRSFFTDRFAAYAIFSDDNSAPSLFYHREHYPERIPLLYLHGALHLYRWHDTTTKLRRSAELGSLGQQVRNRLAIGLEPEIILDGSAKRKLRGIEQSSYLRDVLQLFRQTTGTLVTYGWAFHLQDQHLVDAILQNQNLAELWIGVYGDFESIDNQEMRARIGRRLAAAAERGNVPQIIFYDADSVPF